MKKNKIGILFPSETSCECFNNKVPTSLRIMEKAFFHTSEICEISPGIYIGQFPQIFRQTEKAVGGRKL